MAKEEKKKKETPVADPSSPVHTMDGKETVKVRADILRQLGVADSVEVPADALPNARFDITVAELRKCGFAKDPAAKKSPATKKTSTES